MVKTPFVDIIDERYASVSQIINPRLRDRNLQGKIQQAFRPHTGLIEQYTDAALQQDADREGLERLFFHGDFDHYAYWLASQLSILDDSDLSFRGRVGILPFTHSDEQREQEIRLSQLLSRDFSRVFTAMHDKKNGFTAALPIFQSVTHRYMHSLLRYANRAVELNSRLCGQHPGASIINVFTTEFGFPLSKLFEEYGVRVPTSEAYPEGSTTTFMVQLADKLQAMGAGLDSTEDDVIALLPQEEWQQFLYIRYIIHAARMTFKDIPNSILDPAAVQIARRQIDEAGVAEIVKSSARAPLGKTISDRTREQIKAILGIPERSQATSRRRRRKR